jgi:hypothetical protein
MKFEIITVMNQHVHKFSLDEAKSTRIHVFNIQYSTTYYYTPYLCDLFVTIFSFIYIVLGRSQ